MQLEVNGKKTQVSDGTSIFDAIRAAGETIAAPELGEAKQWIRNPICPLLGLAEVDEQLVPLPALRRRTALEGMSIQTASPAVKNALEERSQLLTEKHECFFVREWQKNTVVEGENTGFVTFDQWKRFAFSERGAAPSIVHDPNKCIRCKACIETCRDVQGVEALSYDETQGVLIDEERCVRCGQCIHRCPMGNTLKNRIVVDFFQCGSCAFARPLGAMHEVDDTGKAWHMLHDPELYCVVEFAPAVRASIGQEFDIPAGELSTGNLNAALRRVGFKKVWDTNFAADLTIMEEGSEFIERLTKGGCLPLFTSCSPGWVRFAETFFPDLLPHVSSAKSPQQMFGAVAKSFGAQSLSVKPESMRVISIMPCTAKKAEAGRPEMDDASSFWREHHAGEEHQSFPDVDLVLTTREAAFLIKMAGIDLRNMPAEDADPLLGEYTGAAPIFGRTGGVMEAALRTVITLLTGQPPAQLEFEDLGSLDGIKRAALPVGDVTVKVAVVHGLGNARQVCESIRTGGEFSEYHFIEFMACPGGCIGGGGQPIPTNVSTKIARTLGVNRDDREVRPLRMSHLNSEVQGLYDSFLEKPLGHRSHHLLHTEYAPRQLKVNEPQSGSPSMTDAKPGKVAPVGADH